MTTDNLITIVAFVAIVLLGFMLSTVVDMYKNRPSYRIKARLYEQTSHNRTTMDSKILADLRRAQSDARRRRLRQAMGTFGSYLNRLDTVAGHQAARYFYIAAVLLVFTGLVLLLIGFIPFNLITLLLALVGVPLFILLSVYNYLVQRFNKRFIGQLPDAMDAIVRASQAGVPITQSIRDIGEQMAAPLGPEFKRMGNAMLLGHELEEVFDEAVVRIELPDFSFFAVCVLLQREAGGSITEALENLANIIRARRDLGLKAKALTAEGRLSGMFIAAIPFLILLMLYFVNPDYVMVLFTTETGHTLLWVAGIMLTIGLLAIRHLTNLKV